MTAGYDHDHHLDLQKSQLHHSKVMLGNRLYSQTTYDQLISINLRQYYECQYFSGSAQSTFFDNNYIKFSYLHFLKYHFLKLF